MIFLLICATFLCLIHLNGHKGVPMLRCVQTKLDIFLLHSAEKMTASESLFILVQMSEVEDVAQSCYCFHTAETIPHLYLAVLIFRPFPFGKGIVSYYNFLLACWPELSLKGRTDTQGKNV